MKNRWRHAEQLLLISVFSLLAVQTASADVRLPHIFGNHMVLQREKPVVIWGWAEPSEKVTVTFQSKQKEISANERGEWKTVFPAMKAGGPYTLTVSGTNTITLDNIMMGEVWLCSGQSNMGMPVQQCLNAEQNIAAANYPEIRLLTVPPKLAVTPQSDINAAWVICTPTTVGGFSAAAYFFGREIHKTLKVPVGLINSSWGGTRIEPWTPPEGFAAVPALKTIYDRVLLANPHSEAHKEWLSRFLKDTENWLPEARKALDNETAIPNMPAWPQELQPQKIDNSLPTVLYNAMIYPLIPFSIRGMIWYQGESNVGDGMQYTEKMKALVGGWRQMWGQNDLPFYYVQIAPYNYGAGNSPLLPSFWEAQAAVLNVIPNTGMALTIDIGDLINIHPKNKQDVGKRLALLALAKTYGQTSLVCAGPTYKSMTAKDDKIRLNFDNVGGGLVSRDAKPLNGFEIFDADKGAFVKAQAEIDGATVVLSAEEVKNPAAARLGWDMTDLPNLMNREGLPAGPFRTTAATNLSLPALPARTGKETTPDLLYLNVPEAKNYRLVYDLDLAKTGPVITYTVDDRSKIKQPFDRVAYFLELQTGNTEIQYVYVSMDAFTDYPGKIGVPTADSQAFFQQNVANLTVFSNVKSIVTGTGIQTGNIEFWPNNYGTNNVKSVPNASSDVYDFGDWPVEPVNGYGCMQVHNYGAKQTIFSFNQWAVGPNADIGIGNNPGGNPDWTFAKNGPTYSVKRLRVLVRYR